MIEDGIMCALPSELNTWRKNRDEGRCPFYGHPCPARENVKARRGE